MNNPKQVFAVTLVFFLSMQLAFAVTEFEQAFYQQQNVLIKAYEPCARVKDEIFALREEIDRKEKEFIEKDSVEILSKEKITSKQKPSYDAALQARDAMMNEVNQLIQRYEALGRKLDKLSCQFIDRQMKPLVGQYSWAIPNDEAISQIVKYSPLIEVGAGSGYWPHLLEQAGADIVAYDDHSWIQKKYHSVDRNWFPVQNGNEDELLNSEHSGRTLFLCWPPGQNDFAFNVLKNYSGQYLIYVGELPGGIILPSTANENYFQLLNEEFRVIHEVQIPNWPGKTDKVYIYERMTPAEKKKVQSKLNRERKNTSYSAKALTGIDSRKYLAPSRGAFQNQLNRNQLNTGLARIFVVSIIAMVLSYIAIYWH